MYGYFAVGACVLWVLSERPGTSIVILAIGAMAFGTTLLWQRFGAIGLATGLATYVGMVGFVLTQLFPMGGDPTNLILILFLPIVIIVSWGGAMGM